MIPAAGRAPPRLLLIDNYDSYTCYRVQASTTANPDKHLRCWTTQFGIQIDVLTL